MVARCRRPQAVRGSELLEPHTSAVFERFFEDVWMRQWCTVSLPGHHMALDPTARGSNEPTSRGEGLATSIFHPPRA
jgi:hypothetical protein